MNHLKLIPNPKHIIQVSTTASEQYLVNQFMEVIDRIYRYELFKPMMDLVATKAFEKKLTFKITSKENFHLDEGNCKTIESGTFNKILNRFVAKKEYTVTIRKISPDVIIHEIGHMMEKEANLKLDQGFNSAIKSDIKTASYTSVSLGQAINNVMVSEVKGYPVDQLSSELFTRYFQLLAMSKEVSGKGAEYAFNLSEVYKAFPATEKWMFDNLQKELAPRYNIDIVEASKKYIQPIESIEHKWSDEKVKSFHNDKADKAWSKSIKSIKDE